MPRPSNEAKAEAAWKRIQAAIKYYDQVRRPAYERAWLVYATDASYLVTGLATQMSGIGVQGGALWTFGLIGSEDVTGSAGFYPAKLNVATTIINTKLAALTTQKPVFNPIIYDERYNTPEMVALVRWLIDWMWDDAEVQRAVQTAYLSKELFGFGLIEIGETVELDTDGNVIGRRIAVSGIPATRVLYDLNARYPSLSACRWIAKVTWVERHVLEDLAEAGKWRNVDKVHVGYRGFKPFEENIRMNMLEISALRDEEVEEDKKAVLFHYYDAYEKRIYILSPAENYDYPYVVLHTQELNTGFKDFYPFVMLAGQELPEAFHPLSDYALLEPHLDLLERFVSIYLNHSLRNIPKFAYVENALTEQGRRGLSSPSVAAGIEVRGMSPASAIQPLVTEAPKDGLIQMIVLAEKYLNEAAGLTHYHRAEVPPRVKSATESSYLVQLSGVRGQHEAQSLEKAMGQLAEKMYGYFRMLQTPIPVKVPTPDGGYQVVMISANDTPPTVRIEVNAGSTAFMDRQQDRADMMALMEILGNLLGTGMAAPLLPVLKHILTTFPQLNPSDVMQILQSAVQFSQMQQLQQQMMQARMLQSGRRNAETVEPAEAEEGEPVGEPMEGEE